ncbi:MAG: folate family ECF transporter S component [Clostridia bacterium]|nr:folate family ECF transporter S component [Clostridia bacterium]
MSKNHSKSLRNVRVLCAVALLAGLAIVIAYVCKSFTITPSLRVTFENLPIILCGYLFGPFLGALCGAAADLISTPIFGYSINPLITVGAAAVGFTAGAVRFWIFRRDGKLPLLCSVASAHFIGNILIKSIAFVIWYGTPLIALLPRIPLYIGIAAIEFFLLWALLRNRGIQNVIGEIKG